MPATTVSLDALEEKGWFLSQEGLDSLKEQLGAEVATLEQIIELAKDTDLRELSEKGFRKGDLTKLSQLPSTLVLQVLHIQNIAVPSIQHVEKPRLLRVVFTDGSSKKKWIGAEILGQVESISLHTPPGTKFLVTKPIDIREQLLILGPGMLSCIGGQVQEMIQAWKAGKQFIKRTKGNQASTQEDLPPPFIPFKVKTGHTAKEKNKESKEQIASAPGSSQTSQKDAQRSGNDNNKNRRIKEKDGKRKDVTATKSNKKKDDGPTKKDGRLHKKDDGPIKKDGGLAKTDGGSTKKDNGSAKKDGGLAKTDGGSIKKDNGSAKKGKGSAKKDDRSTKNDGESTTKANGPVKKDTKPTKKESKSANTESRSADVKPADEKERDKNNKKSQQGSKGRTKQEDKRKSNQTPTDETISNNKSKNKSRNQQHPHASSSQQQKQDSPSLPATPLTNDHKPTVLSASSKPFIPSSFPIQQQQQPTDAPSAPSSRGRGSNRGNRGRGNRGRGRGRGTDE